MFRSTTIFLALTTLTATAATAAAQVPTDQKQVRILRGVPSMDFEESARLGFGSTPAIFSFVTAVGTLANPDRPSWRVSAYIGGSVGLTAGLFILVPALMDPAAPDEAVPLGLVTSTMGLGALTAAIVTSENARKKRRANRSTIDTLSLSPGQLIDSGGGTAPSLFLSGRF